MAPTFSPNARHALSTLSANVNPPTSRASIITGIQTGGTEVPHKMVEASISPPAHQKNQSFLLDEARMASKEGAIDISEQRPTKRQRRELEGAPVEQENSSGDDKMHELAESKACGDPDVVHMHPSGNSIALQSDSDNQSPSASPASSFKFNSSVLNDSQNTIITEPDDIPHLSFSRPPARTLTKEEAREKAETLRLRLRLANYRVRTNQITVPLKDLQVRTMSSPKLPLPLGTFSNWKTTESPSASNNRLTTSKPVHISNTGSNIPSSPPSFYTTSKSTSSTRHVSAATSISASSHSRRDEIAAQTLMRRTNTQNSNTEHSGMSVYERQIATAGLLSLMGQKQP